MQGDGGTETDDRLREKIDHHSAELGHESSRTVLERWQRLLTHVSPRVSSILTFEEGFCENNMKNLGICHQFEQFLATSRVFVSSDNHVLKRWWMFSTGVHSFG